MKLVILDMLPSVVSQDLWDKFDFIENIDKYDDTLPQERKERIKDADYLIVNKVVIGKEEIDAASNLKYIGVVSTGYNVIDTDYAREKGITVTNVPGYGTDTVAEYTIGLMLAGAKRFEYHSQSVKAGDWSKKNIFSYSLTPQYDVTGKNLGIIGYGRIGQRVGEIAKAFKMTIYALERDGNYRVEDGVHHVGLDEILEKSDFISLNCNLTHENEKMVNSDFIGKMKDGAYLVNTARGGLVDEEALAQALNSGKLSGAAVDVVSVEPILPDNPLLKADNIIITPHMAWLSQTSVQNIMDTASENLKKFIQGIIQNKVN